MGDSQRLDAAKKAPGVSSRGKGTRPSPLSSSDSAGRKAPHTDYQADANRKVRSDRARSTAARRAQHKLRDRLSGSPADKLLLPFMPGPVLAKSIKPARRVSNALNSSYAFVCVGLDAPMAGSDAQLLAALDQGRGYSTRDARTWKKLSDLPVLGASDYSGGRGLRTFLTDRASSSSGPSLLRYVEEHDALQDLRPTACLMPKLVRVCLSGEPLEFADAMPAMIDAVLRAERAGFYRNGPKVQPGKLHVRGPWLEWHRCRDCAACKSQAMLSSRAEVMVGALYLADRAMEARKRGLYLNMAFVTVTQSPEQWALKSAFAAALAASGLAPTPERFQAFCRASDDVRSGPERAARICWGTHPDDVRHVTPDRQSQAEVVGRQGLLSVSTLDALERPLAEPPPDDPSAPWIGPCWDRPAGDGRPEYGRPHDPLAFWDACRALWGDDVPIPDRELYLTWWKARGLIGPDLTGLTSARRRAISPEKHAALDRYEVALSAWKRLHATADQRKLALETGQRFPSLARGGFIRDPRRMPGRLIHDARLTGTAVSGLMHDPEQWVLHTPETLYGERAEWDWSCMDDYQRVHWLADVFDQTDVEPWLRRLRRNFATRCEGGAVGSILLDDDMPDVRGPSAPAEIFVLRSYERTPGKGAAGGGVYRTSPERRGLNTGKPHGHALLFSVGSVPLTAELLRASWRGDVLDQPKGYAEDVAPRSGPGGFATVTVAPVPDGKRRRSMHIGRDFAEADEVFDLWDEDAKLVRELIVYLTKYVDKDNLGGHRKTGGIGRPWVRLGRLLDGFSDIFDVPSWLALPGGEAAQRLQLVDELEAAASGVGAAEHSSGFSPPAPGDGKP